MKVGVNLLWMRPGVVGGSEEATVAALHAVADLGRDDVDATLFAVRQFAHAHADLAARFATITASIDGVDKVRRVAYENLWLRREAQRAGVDLVHHGGGVVPPLSSGPSVVTIHDLQPLDLPSNFSVVKRTYLRAMLGRSARAASVVVAPSEFTAQRIVSRLGIDRDKVMVVPWSVGPVAGGDSDRAAARESVRSLALGDRFILLPAITYSHKNHAALLGAFELVAAEDPEVELVLTGGIGPAEEQLSARISASSVAGRIHRLGRVPSPTLRALYLAATAVVFPSRYEGFGLPVLEAMACGCPVIVSTAEALDEVAPAAAPRVSPDDIGGWATAINAVLADPDARAVLSASGRAEAQRYDPGRTARGLIDAWERALT